MRNIPRTIEEHGLKNYLDETKDIHDNFGYDEFVRMVGVNPTMPKVDKSNLGRTFCVDRRTISSWLEVYEKELAK